MATPPCTNLSEELGIPKSQLGGYSELLVALDLIRRGYHVYRALNQHAPFDLVAAADGMLLSIEVRTASSYDVTGSLCFTRTGDYDLLAVVTPHSQVTYPDGDPPTPIAKRPTYSLALSSELVSTV